MKKLLILVLCLCLASPTLAIEKKKKESGGKVDSALNSKPSLPLAPNPQPNKKPLPAGKQPQSNDFLDANKNGIDDRIEKAKLSPPKKAETGAPRPLKKPVEVGPKVEKKSTDNPPKKK